MRMLRWIMGIFLRDKKRNVDIRAELGSPGYCREGDRDQVEMVRPCRAKLAVHQEGHGPESDRREKQGKATAYGKI